MIANKDMTIEELKEIAVKSDITFEPTITKEELFKLIEKEENNKAVAQISSESVDEEAEKTVEEVSAETVEENIKMIDETNVNDSTNKKKNKKAAIIIGVAMLVIIGLISVGVAYAYINMKSYDISDRVETDSVKDFNETVERIDLSYQEYKAFLDYDIDSSLSIEDQLKKYKDTMAEGEYLETKLTEIYEYIIECEKDLTITDEEVKGLNKLADEFEKELEDR